MGFWEQKTPGGLAWERWQWSGPETSWTGGVAIQLVVWGAFGAWELSSLVSASALEGRWLARHESKLMCTASGLSGVPTIFSVQRNFFFCPEKICGTHGRENYNFVKNKRVARGVKHRSQVIKYRTLPLNWAFICVFYVLLTLLMCDNSQLADKHISNPTFSFLSEIKFCNWIFLTHMNSKFDNSLFYFF